VQGPGAAVDAVVSVVAPDQSRVHFAAEAKVGLPSVSAQALVEQALYRTRQSIDWIRQPKSLPAGELHPMVVVEYANPALRNACVRSGVSFLDLTGWASIVAAGPPAIVIHTQGAERSPIVRNSAINRLDGPGASRVIRTLWDISEYPIGPRALAAMANVSPGTVSRVLPALVFYGAVVRNQAGQVVERDRRLVMERWIQDYGFRTSHRSVGWFVAARGQRQIDELLASEAKGLRLRTTGQLAAQNLLSGLGVVPVVPLQIAAFYTDDTARLADALQLHEAEPAEANVVIAEPREADDLNAFVSPDTQDRWLQEFVRLHHGRRSEVLPVTVPQVIADLLTMGGRNVDLGEQLLDLVGR
jgi:hypothetical protein